MKKNIVFMGTPEFSVETLKVLKKSQFEIKCVYNRSLKTIPHYYWIQVQIQMWKAVLHHHSNKTVSTNT